VLGKNVGEIHQGITAFFSSGSERTLRAHSTLCREVPTIIAVTPADLPGAQLGATVNLPDSSILTSFRLSTASMHRSSSGSNRLRRSGHHGRPDLDRHPSSSPAPRQPRRSRLWDPALAPGANGQPLTTSMQPTAPLPCAPVPLFRPREANPETGLLPPLSYMLGPDITSKFQYIPFCLGESSRKSSKIHPFNLSTIMSAITY
jgi:hypothetical protein